MSSAEFRYQPIPENAAATREFQEASFQLLPTLNEFVRGLDLENRYVAAQIKEGSWHVLAEDESEEALFEKMMDLTREVQQRVDAIYTPQKRRLKIYKESISQIRPEVEAEEGIDQLPDDSDYMDEAP